MIDVFLLIGIVKKNGTMFVDFAIQAERDYGVGAGRIGTDMLIFKTS